MGNNITKGMMEKLLESDRQRDEERVWATVSENRDKRWVNLSRGDCAMGIFHFDHCDSICIFFVIIY